MVTRRNPIVPREEIIPGGRTRNSYVTNVVASPTDPGSLPAPSTSELSGLLEGLGKFDQNLGSYLQRQDKEEAEAGRQARQAGQAQPEDAGEAFVGGYMSMDMTVKGDQDGAALAQEYETGFDPSKDNFDDWLATKYGERVQGMDESFKYSYDASMSKHVQKVREAHTKAEADRVTERVDTNALYLLDKQVEGLVEEGKPLDQVGIDGLRTQLKALGVGGDRFNELLFAAIKKYGDDGNPSVYAALKETKPDGTPGMYFIPAWKAKIDAAEERAITVFLQKQKAVEDGLHKQRAEMQEEEVGKLMQLEDPAEIRDGFQSLVRRGIVTNASDIDKFSRIIETNIKREASPAQQEAEFNLLSRIYSGQSGPMDILRDYGRGLITSAQRKTALSEWYRVKNDAKQANSADNSLNQRFNSPLVRQAQQIISKTILDSERAEWLELFPDRRQALRLRALAASTEFTRALAAGEVAPGKEIEYADKLVKQYSATAAPEPAEAATQKAPAKPPKVIAEKARKDAAKMTAKELEDFMRENNIPIPD